MGLLQSDLHGLVLLGSCSRSASTCMHVQKVVCRAGDLKGRVTAGAVSAALRELRPVEIVGVYEDTIEGLKVMQQESQLRNHMLHMPKLV